MWKIIALAGVLAVALLPAWSPRAGSSLAWAQPLPATPEQPRQQALPQGNPSATPLVKPDRSPPTASPPAGAPTVTAPAVPSHRGQWMTEGGKSRVEVSDCGPQVCAKIVWLKEPNDDKGKPLHDAYNKNPQLRNRPIQGLPLFDAMSPTKTGWEGKVYNPEEGDWFDVTVWLSAPDRISIKGCVLFICETHNWTRAAPATTVGVPGATPVTTPGAASAAKR